MSQQNTKYFITINSQIDDPKAFWDPASMEYLAICMEAAPTTGHIHYHCLVVYFQRRRLSAVIKEFPGAHVQIAKGSINQIIAYLTKDGNLILEEGIKPIDLRRHSETPSEIRFRELVEASKRGQLDKECLMYARYRTYFNQLEVQHMLRMKVSVDLTTKNIWIYGPPGSGKSKMVQDYLETHKKTCYLKLLNKWWDGYFKQDVVLLEDADPFHCSKLAHHFKIWCDRYSFTAEVKNGVLIVFPEYEFVVTSNYSIDECFDAIDASAIRRRFDIFRYE